MADCEDTIVEAELAECASTRETVLATLRNLEKATENHRAAARHLEQSTKECHETLRKLDEFTGNLKRRRFDKLDQVVEDLENLRVKGGDGRKDGKTPHTSFKHASAVQQSRLLSLAPEIRNMIWKLCLFHPKDLTTKLEGERHVRKKYGCLTMTPAPGSAEARPKLMESYEWSTGMITKQLIRKHSLRNLALMQTCQDVYNETAPFLWSQRFYFQNIMHLQAFLFSKARLDLVRDVLVLRVDRQAGVNHMPAVCAVLADKVKGLERFEVDMSNMDKFLYSGSGPPYNMSPKLPSQRKRRIQGAGVKLGFDIYSCMYPWLTKVVREQGIEKLMAILQIPRQEGETLKGKDIRYNWRTHKVFAQTVQLSSNELKIANTATAGEILRLINLYDN